MILDHRSRQLNDVSASGGPVVYWMSRDQRSTDNWALHLARSLARDLGRELRVVFCLTGGFPSATRRHYCFMVPGLKEVETCLHNDRIPFHVILGNPDEAVPRFIQEIRAGILVTDFDPLRIKRQWTRGVLSRINIPLIQVDAHNIVPCWRAYPRAAYGAHVLRRPMM
ncbi:MAG TPA: deoxyribodipyrimidine photo-lyase, partial [bacterium]|nr:deoxyribodipyrimidine photo-lyase [bacterium]